jgi:hypothetical protein
MQEGECWYLNLSLPHRVVNQSSTDRVHLVIDCKVNAWVSALMTENSLLRKETPDSPVPYYDSSTQEKIIAELRQQQTPAALELADKLERELLST